MSPDHMAALRAKEYEMMEVLSEYQGLEEGIIPSEERYKVYKKLNKIYEDIAEINNEAIEAIYHHHDDRYMRSFDDHRVHGAPRQNSTLYRVTPRFTSYKL